MRRRTVVPRRAFALLAPCCLLAFAACTKGRGQPDTAAAANARGLVGGPPAGTPHAVPPMPGALPKPVDSLSGDELYDFTHKLAFGGGVEKERKCKGSPECSSSKPLKTKLRVDAVDGQDSVSVTALAPNGTVAMKALNNGSFPDELYGMTPGKNLEYFLILLPGTDLGARWRLEQLDTTPNARKHSQIATGTFKPCMHTFVPHKVNRANFYTCADAAHMTSDSVTRSGLALQIDRDPPLWLDCAQGCCVASSP